MHHDDHVLETIEGGALWRALRSRSNRTLLFCIVASVCLPACEGCSAEGEDYGTESSGDSGGSGGTGQDESVAGEGDGDDDAGGDGDSEEADDDEGTSSTSSDGSGGTQAASDDDSDAADEEDDADDEESDMQDDEAPTDGTASDSATSAGGTGGTASNTASGSGGSANDNADEDNTDEDDSDEDDADEDDESSDDAGDAGGTGGTDASGGSGGTGGTNAGPDGSVTTGGEGTDEDELPCAEQCANFEAACPGLGGDTCVSNCFQGVENLENYFEGQCVKEYEEDVACNATADDVECFDGARAPSCHAMSDCLSAL